MNSLERQLDQMRTTLEAVARLHEQQLREAYDRGYADAERLARSGDSAKRTASGAGDNSETNLT